MRKFVIRAVTFVIFGLLIASFAVWGIGDVFQAAQPNAPVAEVGDIEIGQREFSRTLSREVNRLGARLGGRFDMEQARALGVVDQVLGQMVGRALFDQKSADLGLIVTEELIKRRIAEEPAFRDEAGRFDRNRFVQTLRASNLGEQEFVAGLRRDILRQQLVGAITESATAPRTLAETLYAYREETRTARVLSVPNGSIADLPTPDEPALRAFHKEFSNNFMAPEYRSISFVQLRAEDLASEVSVSETELRAEFEARRDEFAVRERRAVEQIVFDDEAAAKAAMERFRDGANFETVSRDAIGQAPVDLGTVERDSLPEALAAAAFALGPGEIGAPVKTGFGWHIVRVREILPGAEPDLEKAREGLARDMAMSRAIDSMVSIANQLDDELAGGATIDEAANRLDLEARRIDAIDRDGRDASGNPIGELPQDRFLEVAFDTAPGEDSLLTETGDGGFFILRVERATPPAPRRLDQVRDEVIGLWRDARRAEKAREIATALAERAGRGESLERIGQAEGYEVALSEPLSRFESDPSRNFAPALTSKLFALTPGKIETVAAPDSHIVFELVEVSKADPASKENEVATLRRGLSNAMRNDLLEQFVATLRGEYGVTVNRAVIDNLLLGF